MLKCLSVDICYFTIKICIFFVIRKTKPGVKALYSGECIWVCAFHFVIHRFVGVSFDWLRVVYRTVFFGIYRVYFCVFRWFACTSVCCGCYFTADDYVIPVVGYRKRWWNLIDRLWDVLCLLHKNNPPQNNSGNNKYCK